MGSPWGLAYHCLGFPFLPCVFESSASKSRVPGRNPALHPTLTTFPSIRWAYREHLRQRQCVFVNILTAGSPNIVPVNLVGTFVYSDE